MQTGFTGDAPSARASIKRWPGTYICNLFAAVLACVGLAGCEQQRPPANDPTSTPSPKASPTPEGGDAPKESTTSVVLALNWFPEVEHGGYYAALVHGYYAEEGLKVTIRAGGPKAPVLADVALGTVDFAVDNADKLLLSRVQQADNVALMAPIQNSPRCIMVHKSSGLKRLEDLKGKQPFKLAMNTGQPFAMFLKSRVDLEGLQIVAYPGNVAQFLAEVDYGQQAYSFAEPFQAEQKGGDPECLMLSDLGFNTYTSMLIARRETIDKKPDLVRKMVRASIRGWQKYLSDPQETNKYIHEENAEMPLDVLEFGVAALKPLCLPEGFAPELLGDMSATRWTTLTEQMQEIGLIPMGTVSALDAFTMQFLSVESGK